MAQWLASVIDPYYQQVLMLVGIYIIAALGLNLITGVCGQLTFGHAAFLSIGAYTAAILTRDFHMPFLASLILGGLMAALFGVLLGIPVLKLTGDYLGIATLGFGEIVRVAFTNMKITGGAIGLAAIPRASNLINVTVFVILAVVAMVLLENSRFGRALRAIREDEIAAGAMGINTMWYKIQAFGIGCFLAGISGGFYAHLLQYLNPNDFGFLKSFEILNFVVLGGLGSIPGTIVGTTVLTLAPEFLRFVQEYRMMIYGLLLVLMMIFRPNGLLGGVNFRRLLRRRKQKAAAISG
ncbi:MULTISPECIES: branched-chain amino acid ABC transporter permease [Desulfofundulus]|jgi:branched-chain amino acid transport system permease protein|uniref:Amino acid/amide ABC transporter membrane protein 2, HAAT family (TC 3.A.1.4.-) n=1 Tax=Desulfofundulus australicus DSM 11792 TaxID=1121425 RepID=A0A1M4T5E8_9FIRM|nr:MULTISPECIES: branched-chain amino acid ABC transporter permease [Desulfofundulus]MBE3585493.1 branched-chain amino acid ABC transporter permease [Thermoanaerobacter sp.]MCS5696237.1 branched-chain amino acid ABC transporter permease [Desulfofundulus thermocisternus]SHE39548.1 amino acid/amide ABC transporter membrane protein 2, HAAT family (TC 3.A.1.4.-) [Desulfofundulus australicus DSM 11792]